MPLELRPAPTLAFVAGDVGEYVKSSFKFDKFIVKNSFMGRLYIFVQLVLF
jgi:hypothetical protein